MDAIWLDEQAELTLERLLPHLDAALARQTGGALFLERLKDHFADAFAALYTLYGGHYDFYYHLEQTILTVAALADARPADLKALDVRREAAPGWFQSEQMLGASCSVDLFAGTLEDVRARIPYFEELGLTYLHLMPPFRSRGSYREVDPALAHDLRAHGISLALDVALNHTSDEHEWAQRAQAGDRRYQAYYSSRWELNYANPEVFRAMLEQILFLANQGAEILRLDTVSLIGSDSGTQPHAILRGLNAFARMAAPALLLESGALVEPRRVDASECPLSDNSSLMVAIWEALATRSVEFFRLSMNKHFPLPPDCAWINYLRSHNEIVWTFADKDAAEAGLKGADHRYFLNLFYLGRFPGSFAAGLPFHFDPRTQEMHISGTTASLAGLEKAIRLDDSAYAETAIRRIILIHSLILSVGGIPLICLGDEIGTLNDSRYRSDPTKADDSRWAQRAPADAQAYERRHDPASIEGQIFQALLHLIGLRQQTPALADGETDFISTGNAHVLGYTRHHTLLVLANFSEFPQQVDVNAIQNGWPPIRAALDLVSGQPIVGEAIRLEPYQFMWLMPAEAARRYGDADRAD